MFFGNPSFVSWQEVPEFGILPAKHPPSPSYSESLREQAARQARKDAKILEAKIGRFAKKNLR